MQIDWFTFACQVVNFLVLVWLLKRFLYAPIQRAIDERERTIAESLQAAADREAAARAAQQSYESRQAELSHLKDSLLAETTAQVDQWRKDRLQELRQEVADARKSWYESVSREQQQVLGELRQRTAQQVQHVARHVLRELADCDLEQKTIHHFLAHFQEQWDGEGAHFGNGRTATGTVVRTALALSQDDRKLLTEAFGKRLGNGPIRFEVDGDLICGIEVVSGDHKLQWNVDHYLESLEQSITTALEHHATMPPRVK